MNNNFQKWIDALKSDKYKQGTGSLKYTDRNNETCHCVLGVAVQLFEDENPDVLETSIEESVFLEKKSFKYFSPSNRLTYHNVLPPEVCEWLGLPAASSGGPQLPAEGYSTKLRDVWELNDDGVTFKEIASKLESELLK